MRIDISFKYLKKSEFVNNLLESNFKKLKKRTMIFRGDDSIHLSVHIEKNPHKEQFFCRCHLYLPTSKVLIVEEKAQNSSLVINKSFSALVRQLDKEKYRVQNQRRKARRSRKESALKKK